MELQPYCISLQFFCFTPIFYILFLCHFFVFCSFFSLPCCCTVGHSHMAVMLCVCACVAHCSSSTLNFYDGVVMKPQCEISSCQSGLKHRLADSSTSDHSKQLERLSLKVVGGVSNFMSQLWYIS